MATILQLAVDKLGKEFAGLDLSFHPIPGAPEGEVTSYWPGPRDEDVLVCVFKGKSIREPFHRQDFFFINYAYSGSYEALSARFDHQITIRENECYIGQPYAGYALRARSDADITIIGVLIRKEAFFREYLSVLSSDADLFRFFLEPRKDRYSDEFIHLAFDGHHPVRKLLELMVIEYADRGAGTQAILKPMTIALLMHIARRYRLEKPDGGPQPLSRRMIRYMEDHLEAVSLSDLGRAFSYHPTYVCALLKSETGETFSRILLRQRMERAATLLQNTTLSVEEIAAMAGYPDHSNFYRAFKAYYGVTPRDLVSRENPEHPR